MLLLDEPTSALDIGHQQACSTWSTRCGSQDELTVVAAMHDLTLAGQYGRRVVLLHQGRVVADASPAEVLRAGPARGGLRRPGRGAAARRRPGRAPGAGRRMSVLVAAALDAGLDGAAGPRSTRSCGPGATWTRCVAGSRSRAAGPWPRAVAAWLGGAVAAVALARLAALARRARRTGAVLRGLALWPLLSARMLLAEVAAVETALRDGHGGRRDRAVPDRQPRHRRPDRRGGPRRGGRVAGREPLGLRRGAPVLVRRRRAPRRRALPLRQHRRRLLGLSHPALAVRRPGGRPGRRRAEPGPRAAHRRAAARTGRLARLRAEARRRSRPTPAGRWRRWRCGSTCG